jgi:hypothetical protein
MPEWRLRNAEKEFLQQIMDRAVFNVQMRDTRLCCEHACRAILADQKMLKLATAKFRPLVLDRIKCAGKTYFKSLFKTHGPFVALPRPLRGKALHIRGSELGLVTREETVKVNVATIKDECKLPGARKQMKMHDEIGKDCERELVHKKKRIECIKKIVTLAQITGVADITMVWREFSASTKTMREVALNALAAVCRLQTVYVMDIHKQTYLFPFPIFVQVIHLLTRSSIFAINMGEDNFIFDNDHFKLLADKIEDGSIPLRRWFVESNPERRISMLTYKLVSKEHSSRKKANVDNPNVWTIARRRDKEYWIEGKRDLARLSWLTAPPSAYKGAIKYKTDMQNKTCNWEAACALRADAEKIKAIRNTVYTTSVLVTLLRIPL